MHSCTHSPQSIYLASSIPYTGWGSNIIKVMWLWPSLRLPWNHSNKLWWNFE